MCDVIVLPLLCTLLIACLLSVLLFRSGRAVYGVFLCNLLTNPLMNAGLYLLSRQLGWAGYFLGLPVLEGIVVVAEAVVLARFLEWRPIRAAGTSILLNALSCGAGVLLWMW